MTRLTSIRLGLLTLLITANAFASEWNSESYDLYPGDFNGDGATDVLYVAKSANGRSGIALSNGIEWVAGAQSWDSDGFGVQWHSGAYVPVIGDFNWDGRDDIFLQRQTPGDHVLLLSQIDGTFPGASQTIPNSRAGLTWSGDQHRIIAVRGKSADTAHPKGHRLFLQATTPGGTNAIVDTGFSQLIGTSIVGGSWTDGYRGFTWNAVRSLVQSGDFNGDGEGDFFIQARPSIVIIDYDPPIPIPVTPPASFGIVYSPIANGVTDFWDRMVAGVDWSSANSSVVIGDFNGDGKDDVIVQPKNSSSPMSLILTNASTSLLNRSSPAAITLSGASSAYRALAANINGTSSERSLGLYLQGPDVGSTDLIANNVSAGGGTVATSGQSNSSQVAGSAERPYTMAYRYNLMGQVTGTIAPDPDKQGGTDGPLKYLATRNTYDRGLLVRVESGELQRWVNETVAPANWESVTGFTKFVISEYVYDEYGRKIKELIKRGDTGAIESLAQFNYDSVSRVQCRAVRMNKNSFASPPADACAQDPSVSSAGPDRISKFTYDSLDQVLTEQRGVGTALLQTYVKNEYNNRQLHYQTDANGNKTEYLYDGLGRIQKRIYPSTTVGANAVNPSDYEFFTYEATGNVKTERKRNGSIVTYTYDATNRVTHRDLSDNTYAQNIYYDYYSSGDVRYARFGSNSGPGLINGVDSFGRLKFTSINTPAAQNANGPSRTLAYEYDDNGNRTKIIHPDNQSFGYVFDGLNRVCGISETNSPATCDAGQLILSIVYRKEGGRQSVTRGGTTTSYAPDQVGRLASFTQDFPGSANDLSNEFSYNPANQITQLIQSNTAYAYTGNANRTGTYTRNGLNQVTGAGGQAILYDTNGNLTNDAGLPYSLKYDMENRLVETTGTASVTASFSYDPMGRLARSTIGGVTREFLYDGDALVAEYESGSLKLRYVHGDEVDEPMVQYTDSTLSATSRRYLYADQQSSIIATSDSSGGDVKKLAYDSFGIPQDSNDGRFGYTGQAAFKELGLFYYKARFYSPRLGRFLQRDPIGYMSGMNSYAYVSNDPMNLSDPSGLLEKCAPKKYTETFTFPDGSSATITSGVPNFENQSGSTIDCADDGTSLTPMDEVVVEARKTHKVMNGTIKWNGDEQGFAVTATQIIEYAMLEKYKCPDGDAYTMDPTTSANGNVPMHTHPNGILPGPGPDDGATASVSYMISPSGAYRFNNGPNGYSVTLLKGNWGNLSEQKLKELVENYNRFGGKSTSTGMKQTTGKNKCTKVY